MASRIPIRRPRTLGAENENARPTQAPARAKVLGRAAPLAASSKLGQAAKPATVAGASNAAVASAAPTRKLSAREAEINAILGGANRKRKALEELEIRKNVWSGSMTGQTMYSGMSSENRKILGLPKKSTETTTTAAPQHAPLKAVPLVEQPPRPQVFVPPPANASRTSDVRRLSSRPSLIPVRQQQREQEATVDLDADDEEPLAKRQRTSSIGPEDVPSELSEAEIAADLDAYTDDDAEEVEVEADLDAGDWEDLDAADYDDPMMASEYVVDIQRYLKEVELTTLPSPTYMSSQPSLTWSMRALLNDWLTQVHTRFHLLPETLFLCAHLIDRFLSLRAVAPTKLQLVGMAALLLAAKFEETVTPAIANFTHISEDAFSAQEMRQAEQHILRTLEWDLSYPSPMHWLRRVSKAEGYKPQTRQLGKYLAEIFIVEERLVATPPSLLAAAAMWLARLALGEGDWVAARAANSSSSGHDPSFAEHDDPDSTMRTTVPDASSSKEKEQFTLWTPNLAHYATYTERELLPAAGYMLRYVLQPIRHESFYRKWAGKRNMKVSVYMREWALSRWDEGAKVDLAAELPELKREFRELGRARREREEREAEAEGGETSVEEEEC